MPPARMPRLLHPGAWWVWALAVGAAAARTSNPLLLGLLLAVAGYVVAARRTSAPWSRSYVAFLRLAALVLVVRVALQTLFGAATPGHVLFSVPQVPLPHWAAGVRVGGAVTAEGLAAAAYDGLRLGALLACVGAANALASPGRLLKALPAALYEAGVAVTVALTFAPQTVVAVRRVRAARRLRGRADRGLAGLRGLAVPVLEDALDRSVGLAAAMDARGFGRRGDVPATRRRMTAVLTVAGLLAACASVYGLLDTAAPPALGVPLLVGGTALAAAGIAAGGRRTPRTRYRPDPWGWPEWAVALSGLAALSAYVVTGATAPHALHPSTSPLVVPGLPPLALAGALVALMPAWAAPPLPPRLRPVRARAGAAEAPLEVAA